mgnify:FL=1
MKKTIIYIGFLLAFAGTAQAQEGLKGEIEVSNVSLSVFGDSLRVQMDMDFSALHLPSNRSLSLLPSLRMDTAIIRLPEVDVMGRRQYIQWQRKADRAAMTQVIRRYNSTTQHLHYQTAVPIAERLGLVRLYLDEDSCGCLREVLANRNRLLAEQDFTPAVFVPHFVYVSPQAETRKTRHEKGAAYVDFPVNKTGIYPAYRNNRSELAKIENTINRIKGDADVSINNITIKGYASPEGSYANNSRLAEARTRSLVDYLKKEYPLDASLFQLDYEPEDWEGLRAYVIKGSLPEKDALLGLIDSGLEADAKERRLRTEYPEAYRTLLRDCFPALRHSDYVVAYTVRGFDVEEARKLIWKEPQKLSLQEMYAVAQTYGTGSKEYNEVFETAVRLFPDDEAANLNAANSAMQRNELDRAENYLKRAGDSGEALIARGILAYMKNDLEKAESYFRQAQQRGVKEADNNLDSLLRVKANKY